MHHLRRNTPSSSPLISDHHLPQPFPMDTFEANEELYQTFAEFAMRIYKHAPVVQGAMGFFRMWMKAMHMAKPENPELFSFYFIKAIKYLDMKKRLDAKFYESQGPRLNAPAELERELAKKFQQRVNERVARLRNIFEHELKAGDEAIQAARRTIDCEQMEDERIEREKFRFASKFDREQAAEVSVRKLAGEKQIRTKLLSRDELLKQLADKIVVSSGIQRQIKLSRELGNMRRVEAMSRQLGKQMHKFGVEHGDAFFGSDSEDEMKILMADGGGFADEKEDEGSHDDDKTQNSQLLYTVRKRRHKVIPYNEDNKKFLNKYHGANLGK